MKKTIWPIIAVFVMLVCFPEVNSSAESLQKDLTQEEIYQKLSEISDDVGEELSFDDAEFVKLYAKTSNSPIMPVKTATVSGSNSNSKISANLKGSVSSNHGIVNNSFGGNVTTTVTKGTPTKITTKIRHTAYGLVGSGGVGKVQDKTLTASCNSGKSCTLKQTYPYTASVAYSTTNAEATISYSGGALGDYC
jgi:hypothetical protein